MCFQGLEILFTCTCTIFFFLPNHSVFPSTIANRYLQHRDDGMVRHPANKSKVCNFWLILLTVTQPFHASFCSSISLNLKCPERSAAKISFF